MKFLWRPSNKVTVIPLRFFNTVKIPLGHLLNSLLELSRAIHGILGNQGLKLLWRLFNVNVLFFFL